MAICANVPSRLLPQWCNGYSYTSAHDVQLHIAGTNATKKSDHIDVSNLKSCTKVHKFLRNHYGNVVITKRAQRFYDCICKYIHAIAN